MNSLLNTMINKG